MGYDYVFFDADNTLFDYDRAEGRALEATFQEFGLPLNREMTDLYRSINKRAWKEFEEGSLSLDLLRTERFRRLFEHLGMPGNPELISAFYLRRLGEGAFLVKDALEVLRAAASRCTCCIVTNGIAEVQRSRLSASPLMRYVHGVVISEEVGSQKPDAGIYNAAMNLCGRPQKEGVLMVGDSLTSDILGGLRFGIDTCWYNPSGDVPADGIRPVMEIARLVDLLPILGIRPPSDQ